ncbi:MAG: metal ABC transporter substrate-binding protein [Candidatus Cloacimonetes bacterium]|nr:metal ABC transporter substrate-binding protein [Candidatus Cloacimonadota bacterium]
MRTMVFVILIILILLILFTLLRQKTISNGNDELVIATTIYPYEILVRQIVGDKATVSSLMPPDASPHVYSPTPSDMKFLERADLVVSNGLNLEAHLVNYLKSLRERHISVDHFLTDLLEMSHTDLSEDNYLHSHDHEHHHHNYNPHIWLDPIFLIRISEGLTEIFAELDPENTNYYRENLNELHMELYQLDNIISEDSMRLGNLNIINFHDAFYYFNRRYGINTVGVVVRSPGHEPTPRELTTLGEKIREHQINLITLEPQLNPKAAEILAKQYDLKIEILDPLGSFYEAKSISELLMTNWNTLKRHFADYDRD